MKKLLPAIIFMMAVVCCLNIRCAKINKDQPCGIYQANNQQLFKSGDSRCYYTDNQTGKIVYVDNSNCTCF